MEKRIYLPLQLKVLMQPEMYKTADVLFASQKDGKITYSKRNSQFLKLDEAITDQAVQTLIDKKIIAPEGKENGYWRFRIIEETLEKYKALDWETVGSAGLIPLSEEIKFKNEPPDDVLAKLSDEEKSKLIQRLLTELDKGKREIIPGELPF